MSENGAAPDSPLARLRASYEAAQEADPDRYIDIRPPRARFGALVAKVGRRPDIAGARGVLRTVAALISDDASIEITADELAGVVSSATAGLYERSEDGHLEPLMDGAFPLRFGAVLGATLGYPEVTEPHLVVLLAFTEPEYEGGPPELDTLRLMMCATQIAGILAESRMASQDAAREAVGKASPLSNATTPG